MGRRDGLSYYLISALAAENYSLAFDHHYTLHLKRFPTPLRTSVGEKSTENTIFGQ